MREVFVDVMEITQGVHPNLDFLSKVPGYNPPREDG